MDIAEIAPPPTPDLTTEQPPAPAPSITEAGAALRGETEWTKEPEPTEPAAAETAQPAPEGEPAFTQDESGQWHRPDGTFASAEEVAALNAIPEEPAPAAEPAPESEAIVVPLKARDGSTLEIEVTDPKIAELLRANVNDGMRREEFNRQISEVEAERAAQNEFKAMVRTNPEAVILRELPPEKQISIATALIAQHWDAIYDRLVQFQDNPTERVSAAMQTQITMRDQQADYDRAIAQSQYTTAAERAIRSLVPETVDDATAARFLADAANDIAQAIRANGNTPVPVEQFQQILAPRLALYRFSEPSSASGAAPSPAVPVPPARPLARPVASKAAAPATPSASVPGTTDQARATVRRTVTAQRIAAAVAPHGAGAATVKAPLVPLNADVTKAGQILRQHKGWGMVTGQ